MRRKKIYKKIINTIRRIRFYRKSKKIQNRDVSIICNNCLGGVIYNTLNLQFLSPTINLSFKGDGFIHFTKHLNEYVEHGYFEDLKTKLGYYYGPYALLKCNELPDIKICFTHYKSFDEAVSVWKKRCERINYKKIFILYEARYEGQIDKIDNILSLPYKKYILTSSKAFDNPIIQYMDFYHKNEHNKSITEFVSPFGKRGFDDFDFVNNIFNISFSN